MRNGFLFSLQSYNVHRKTFMISWKLILHLSLAPSIHSVGQADGHPIWSSVTVRWEPDFCSKSKAEKRYLHVQPQGGGQKSTQSQIQLCKIPFHWFFQCIILGNILWGLRSSVEVNFSLFFINTIHLLACFKGSFSIKNLPHTEKV